MQTTTSGILCDYSCAGIEFFATCEGNVVLDILTTNIYSTTNNCYFKAYVDGQLWKNGDSDYCEINFEIREITLKNIPRGTHTIRIIKVSGYIQTQTTFLKLTLTGFVSKTAPAQKELFIEFVGDSICCGWGIIGNHDGSYESQDGSLAYPYLLLEKLDADYSVMALSGRGVVHGGDFCLEEAYKYPSIWRDSTIEHDFERQADIVVLNIGTNDFSHSISAADFTAAYKRLIQYVREKNG